MHNYRFFLSVFFLGVSSCYINAGDRYYHYDGFSAENAIRVKIKPEEESKLAHGSPYEFFVDFNMLNSRLSDLADVSKNSGVFPWKSAKNLPVLEREDMLKLRAVSKNLRDKFLLIHDGHINFDLRIKLCTPSAARKLLNESKYPYGEKGVHVLSTQEFKNGESQLVHDLMQEGLLHVSAFWFKNQNTEGADLFVSLLKKTPRLKFGKNVGLVLEQVLTIMNKKTINTLTFHHSNKDDESSLVSTILLSDKLHTCILNC